MPSPRLAAHAGCLQSCTHLLHSDGGGAGLSQQKVLSQSASSVERSHAQTTTTRRWQAQSTCRRGEETHGSRSKRCAQSRPAHSRPRRLTPSRSQAVLAGLAKNGGLYIPETLPALPDNWQQDWAELSFTELALELYSLFISTDEIPRADLKELIDRSYSTFRHPKVAPLVRTGANEYILELFHGPTFAFKDVALQFLGNLFEYFLQRKNKGKVGADRETLTVVGATSGDTGR